MVKVRAVYIFALKAFCLSYTRNYVLIIDAAVMVMILVTLNPVHDKVSWIQHNVITFVRDLRLVPSTNKTDCYDIPEIC
jgi:hypothetical protein